MLIVFFLQHIGSVQLPLDVLDIVQILRDGDDKLDCTAGIEHRLALDKGLPVGAKDDGRALGRFVSESVASGAVGDDAVCKQRVNGFSDEILLR